jgi:hypothetical protein
MPTNYHRSYGKYQPMNNFSHLLTLTWQTDGNAERKSKAMVFEGSPFEQDNSTLQTPPMNTSLTVRSNT